MIRNYTISSLKSIRELPKLKVAQFTLNSRVYPGKRKTIELLSALPQEIDTDIIIHYDYIYIISRFILLRSSVQNDVLNEIYHIMKYAEVDKRIKGIIMHTDFPIRKECYKSFNEDKVREVYAGSLWDVDKAIQFSETPEEVLYSSFDLFWRKFTTLYGSEFTNGYPIKIYLENTTKTPKIPGLLNNVPGTVENILHYLQVSNTSDLYGMCIDLEHEYAATGRKITVEEILSINQVFNVIVHLNTIPSEVQPKSGKDRHSETTIYDCSINSPEYYQNFGELLDKNNIPYVREVHEDTMYKELELQSK